MSEQCTYNKHCYTGNCVKGICKKSERGGKCLNSPINTCPPDYDCVGNRCVETVSSRTRMNGSTPCDSAHPCSSGEYCYRSNRSGGRCVPARGEGAFCSSELKCGSGLVCYSGYCVPSCVDTFSCIDPNYVCKAASSGKGCVRQMNVKKKSTSTTSKTSASSTSTVATSTPASAPKVKKPWYVKNAPWLISLSVMFAALIILALFLILKKGRSRPAQH